MKPKIVKAGSLKDYLTIEGCFIMENYSADCVSLARARVSKGVTTVSHYLKGVDEIYLITAGNGKVTVGDLEPAEVTVGDVVVIPAGTKQTITSTGKADLIFYCVCTPKFTSACYCSENAEDLLH